MEAEVDYIKGKKYYIIAFNNYYEGTFKYYKWIYGTVYYIFRTRMGDIHLCNNYTFSGYLPYITECRDKMLAEVGVRIFRGIHIRRTPFNHTKHIQYVYNNMPEKLI